MIKVLRVFITVFLLVNVILITDAFAVDFNFDIDINLDKLKVLERNLEDIDFSSELFTENSVSLQDYNFNIDSIKGFKFNFESDVLNMNIDSTKDLNVNLDDDNLKIGFKNSFKLNNDLINIDLNYDDSLNFGKDIDDSEEKVLPKPNLNINFKIAGKDIKGLFELLDLEKDNDFSINDETNNSFTGYTMTSNLAGISSIRSLEQIENNEITNPYTGDTVGIYYVLIVIASVGLCVSFKYI